MKKLFVFAFCLLALGCASNEATPPPAAPTSAPAPVGFPQTLSEAVANPLRTPKNRDRDGARHPAETLAFFGIKPEMTVVEIWPSSGWYTEILAPYLATKGQYIAATRSENDHGENTSLQAWLETHPEIKPHVKMPQFNPPDSLDLAATGSVDMILTFRNVHNWMKKNGEKLAFQAFFTALKPGGILGVVEHRANPKSKNDQNGERGYLPEKIVIALARQAGFILADQSEINANPRDKKNYPDAVWDLPPSLKQGDKNRDRYLAIGESDRMTLKFLKPIVVNP